MSNQILGWARNSLGALHRCDHFCLTIGCGVAITGVTVFGQFRTLGALEKKIRIP